jgi:CRISPR/Cas system Type II protein with McrA/HNH and RuvC-like nuclease domain
MIRIHRSPKPAVLAEKADEWTKEFCDFTGPLGDMPATIRFRYRHPHIKDTVRQDAHEKCMYCESSITQTHPGETDHILPVSKRQELVVDWDNLGYICTDCNREKLDYHAPELPLVNPYREEPSDFLVFYGPVVLQRLGAPKGEITVRRLKLNERPKLLERRKERIQGLQMMLDRMNEQTPGPLRDALESALEDELADEKEYAATARAFVRQAKASGVG